MAVKFKCGNSSFTIKDMTEESLNKLLDDKIASLFMPFDSKDIIRNAFNNALKTGEWIEIE